MTRTVLPHPATGLLLATMLVAGWLAIHVGAIFFWQWRPGAVPIAIALVLVQTWLSTGLFIVAHDCMHNSLAPGHPRLNRIIGTLCLGLYAALSYRALLPKHLAHHAAPGTATDPDFHPGDPRRLLPWFVRFFCGYYTHGQIIRITAVALLYRLLSASLMNIAVFWAVPALLALLQLFVFGTYLPHRHSDDPFADEHHARSNALPLLGSLITCFHFGGYHHEHHLCPGTSWWRLPALRKDQAAMALGRQ